MRRSILRYSALKSSKSLIALSALVAATYSCRLRDFFATESKEPEAPISVTQAAPTLAPIAAPLDVLWQVGQKKVPLARFDAKSCDTNSPEARWQIPFSSPWGEELADFTLSQATKILKAKVRQAEFELLASESGFSNTLLTKVCAALANDQHELIFQDVRDLDDLKNGLATFAPSCRFSRPTEEGWQCQLPTTPPNEALSRLGAIQKRMVMRWSRHPYLLTRRIAVTYNLAGAMNAPNAPLELDRLCHIIKFSLQSELPLSLRTKAWQEGVCDQKSLHRLEVSAIGLTEALDEIEYLKDKLESTSRLGTLTVRVPYHAKDYKDFWISLKPKSSVGFGEPLVLAPSEPAVRSLCWHPLYSETAGLSNVAHELGLMPRTAGRNCRRTDRVSQKGDQALDNYVLFSVTSETEFPIPNGRSKLLRLPEGEYIYTMRPYTENFDAWDGQPEIDMGGEKSTGTLNWTSKIPRTLIKSW